MPSFCKNPVVISAEQWFPDHPVEGVNQPPVGAFQPFPYVDTLEGSHIVSDGDWIVTGIAQEKYPCKDEIFRKTYTPVDDEAAIALGWDDLEDYERRSIIYLETDETLEFS